MKLLLTICGVLGLLGAISLVGFLFAQGPLRWEFLKAGVLGSVIGFIALVYRKEIRAADMEAKP